MPSILITAGKLISTSDIAMASKLQQLVSIDDITGGETPEALRQYGNAISFMFRGDLYELEVAA